MHAIARREYLGLVLGGPPGACRGHRALYGLYFFTLSCQGMRGYHTEAPSPLGQIKVSQNKMVSFELSHEDLSDLGDPDESKNHP